jgi:hypothetical protein
MSGVVLWRAVSVMVGMVMRCPMSDWNHRGVGDIGHCERADEAAQHQEQENLFHTCCNLPFRKVFYSTSCWNRLTFEGRLFLSYLGPRSSQEVQS